MRDQTESKTSKHAISLVTVESLVYMAPNSDVGNLQQTKREITMNLRFQLNFNVQIEF
jgi:hypothetical protein